MATWQNLQRFTVHGFLRSVLDSSTNQPSRRNERSQRKGMTSSARQLTAASPNAPTREGNDGKLERFERLNLNDLEREQSDTIDSVFSAAAPSVPPGSMSAMN